MTTTNRDKMDTDYSTGSGMKRQQRTPPDDVPAVGQPIDAGKSPGSGARGGGYVPTSDFGAPKPGRTSGD